MADQSERGLSKRERWLLAAILGVFILGLPAIFVYPAVQILFNPASYHRALAEQAVTAQVPALVGQLIQTGGNVLLFGSGNQILGVLERSNYDVVIRQIFPGDWVQAQADALIDQFWAFFNFHTSQFRLVVDFRPVKARLNGVETPAIAAQIIQGFPACQEQDLLNFGSQLLQGQVERLPLCKPPDAFIGAANLVVEETLRGASLVMPDQIDLASILWLPKVLGGQRVSAAWALGFGIYRVMRQVEAWLPWLALLLLALTGWLARGMARGPVFWVGIALIIPGIAALLAALIVWLSSRELIPLLIQQVVGKDLLIVSVVVNVAEQVSGQFATWSAIAAWGVTIVGVGLIAGDFWAKRQ